MMDNRGSGESQFALGSAGAKAAAATRPEDLPPLGHRHFLVLGDAVGGNEGAIRQSLVNTPAGGDAALSGPAGESDQPFDVGLQMPGLGERGPHLAVLDHALGEIAEQGLLVSRGTIKLAISVAMSHGS